MGMYTQTGNVPPVGTPQSMMHQQTGQMHQGQQPPPNSQNTQSSLPSPLYPWMRSQFGKYIIRKLAHSNINPNPFKLVYNSITEHPIRIFTTERSFSDFLQQDSLRHTYRCMRILLFAEFVQSSLPFICCQITNPADFVFAIVMEIRNGLRNCCPCRSSFTKIISFTHSKMQRHSWDAQTQKWCLLDSRQILFIVSIGTYLKCILHAETPTWTDLSLVFIATILQSLSHNIIEMQFITNAWSAKNYNIQKKQR